MGNCQTKGATAVAERQAPLDSRSYCIDLGDDDSDDTSVEDARLLVTKASDDDEKIGRQGSESNEHKTSNLKPLGPSELEDTIAAGPWLSSDQITQPQGNCRSIPKIPKATNEDKQCLYSSVSFPIMDELDELVASMSMPLEPAEDDLDVQNEDDAGYVSSSSSSAAGSPQAIDGAMVPFLGSPAPIVNANANASSTTINAETNACESTSAIETQLAVSESKEFCAYGLSKEEASAAAALSGGTQMVVVQEYQNQKTDGNAQVPASRHFTFQDVKEEEQVRDYAPPPTTSPEMMITPPNDPDKAYPQDLYLSPPTPENEIDEGDGHGFLVLPPFAPESAQANTTDIVPHPTAASHNYGDFLSSADVKAGAKPIVKEARDTQEDTTTRDKPKHASKNNEVVQPSENKVDAIVEFISHSIVPVSHPNSTPQSDVLSKRSAVESSYFVDSLVPFEMAGGDKFVHDFSDDDRDVTLANDCVKSEARDVVEERRGSDGRRSPVEEEVEVQLKVSGSMMEEQNRKNSEKVTAMVKARHPSRNAYGGIEVAIESSKKGSEAVKGVESLKKESGAIYPSKSHETKESRKEEEAHPHPRSDEPKLPIEAEPMPKVDPPCPDAATSDVVLSTEHSRGEVNAAATTTKEKERSVGLFDGMPQINQGSTPALKPSSGVPSGGASVASMTHLSRRARNLRKNKPRAYTKKTPDDAEASEAAPVDFLCIAESRSVDTEVSDLHSVFTDATPFIPTKNVTATERSSSPARGRISHRSAQIERLRSKSTTRRGRVSELPTGDKCPNSSEGKPTTSPVDGASLPPKAVERSGRESRYSTASARKLAKVRRARSRSRSVVRKTTTPSADNAKVEETKAAAVDQEEKKTNDNSPDIPVSEEKSNSTDEEESSVSDSHGRPRPHSRSNSRPRTLRERKALASASDTASVEVEKSTVSDATETKRPTSSAHSRTRLSERKARAARMKATSHQTLSSVSSLESSPSIDTTETTSTTEANAENNAGVSNSSTSEVNEGSMKPFKELSSEEKMKKKRVERARRLRAIQH